MGNSRTEETVPALEEDLFGGEDGEARVSIVPLDSTTELGPCAALGHGSWPWQSPSSDTLASHCGCPYPPLWGVSCPVAGWHAPSPDLNLVGAGGGGGEPVGVVMEGAGGGVDARWREGRRWRRPTRGEEGRRRWDGEGGGTRRVGGERAWGCISRGVGWWEGAFAKVARGGICKITISTVSDRNKL
jgi:hypothetical protein